MKLGVVVPLQQTCVGEQKAVEEVVLVLVVDVSYFVHSIHAG